MRNALAHLQRRLRGTRTVGFASALEVEREEEILYLNYLREGMTVFDVGASVGEMSLLFSRFVGNGAVHAFEASAKVFSRLQTVCDLTGRRNVVLNHCAVSDREGVVSLHVYDDHLGWNSLAARPLAEYGIAVAPPRIEEVSATTIDRYCEEHEIERIDLLKIDVEGAEYQVLLGARRMLRAQAVQCVTFEFGQTTFDMDNRPQEIAQYLAEVKYDVRNIIPSDPVFPGGGSAASACFSMHVASPRSSSLQQKSL
jgi:FkbM family methyltransferase